MKNIILLPLDERPCNFDFPSKIFNGEKYTIIRPEHLGQKKTPASYEFIRDFLLANIEKADAAVKIVFKRRGVYLGFQLRKLVRVTHAELFKVRQTADMVNLFAVKLIVIRLLIVGRILRAAHDALERVQLYLRVLFAQFF